MAKPLQLESPGAIQQEISRANLRRFVFEYERDYQRSPEGREKMVVTEC